MPKLSFAVPHALERDEVVRRLKTEADVLRDSLGDRVQNIQETWDNHALTFSFSTFGMSVNGQLSVEPAEVRTTATIPLAALMFKSAIEEKIRERLGELLA